MGGGRRTVGPLRHHESTAGPVEGPCRGGGLWKWLGLAGNSYKAVTPDFLPQPSLLFPHPHPHPVFTSRVVAPPSFQVPTPQTSESSLTSVLHSHPTHLIRQQILVASDPQSHHFCFLVATTSAQTTDVSGLGGCSHFLTGPFCFCLPWSCHVQLHKLCTTQVRAALFVLTAISHSPAVPSVELRDVAPLPSDSKVSSLRSQKDPCRT